MVSTKRDNPVFKPGLQREPVTNEALSTNCHRKQLAQLEENSLENVEILFKEFKMSKFCNDRQNTKQKAEKIKMHLMQ